MQKSISALTLMILCLTIFSVFGCTSQPAPQNISLTISAAASLKEPMTELADIYRKNHPNIALTLNMGASGALMNQIEQGAPVDIFFSAANKQMDNLQSKNLIDPATNRQLLTNDLVLVAPINSPLTSFADLSKSNIKKIAIGEPDSVPAGSYAKAALTAMNLYDNLSPKFILAKDVRQVLTYTGTNNVDAGLVYATDAKQAKDVVVVATAPANSHPPIIYPVAVIKATKYPKEAKEFWDFLLSDQAAQVFEKYGFKIYKP